VCVCVLVAVFGMHLEFLLYVVLICICEGLRSPNRALCRTRNRMSDMSWNNAGIQRRTPKSLS